ncbi:MAG TPA: glycosyltransferase, partial [Burkholderiales bacterium]|nr:glycosyltransferase [Burkholderiales bacterium]
MKISVVVPAFNEEALLPGALGAIRAAMSAFEEAELIVCDNNSTDRTAEIARAAGAKVVFEPVNQIARARNAGAAAASGDWLVFVDADSYPSVELFHEAGRAMKSGCLAGGATLAADSRDLIYRWSMALWNRLSRAARWGAGAFIFCEARAFRALGGFNEELYASEDIDLFRRLKRRAHRDGRVIVILHRHP